MQFIIPEEEIRKRAVDDGITHFTSGVAVIKDGKILIVRRVAGDSWGGYYEIPGGGVDEGETFEQAALRELLEETGLEVKEIMAMTGGLDYQTSTKPKVRQLNFVVRAPQEVEVKLDPNEHDHHLWITAEELGDYPITGQMRECIRAIFNTHL